MFKKFFITPKEHKPKRRKKRKPLIILTKRRKLLIVVSICGIGFWTISYLDASLRHFFITGLVLLTMLLTTWALKEDLRGAAWFLAPVLPSLFMGSGLMFYYLLPQTLIIKLIALVFFGIGMYGILLTENIYSVSAQRTIQLLRAGQALGFLFTLLVAFMMFETIFSFYLNPFYNGLITFLILIPLCLQGVWSASLEEKLNSQIWYYVLALAFVTAQGAMFVSLWPVNIIVSSLFLVTIIYVGLGLIQQSLAGRLFKKTVNEYIRVGVLVFLILIVISRW